MHELLESYVNGNINHVKEQLKTARFTFAEFYTAYKETYLPDGESKRLFLDRLS